MIAHGHRRLRTLCSPGRNLALAYLCTIRMHDQAGRGLIRSVCRYRQQQLTISMRGERRVAPRIAVADVTLRSHNPTQILPRRELGGSPQYCPQRSSGVC